MSTGHIFIFLLVVTCLYDVSSGRRTKPEKPVSAQAMAEARKKARADLFTYAFQMGNRTLFDDSPDMMQRFYPHGYPSGNANANRYPIRPGQATEDHMCDRVTRIPRALTFITRYNHYYKYTHAYSIPIVSTNNVPDAALKRACYVLRFMLGDRQILRKYLYRYYGRVGIIGAREGTRSIPEHSWLPAWWDQRARGLGGTLGIPISTGCEENLLCYKNGRDRYYNQDIFLHEFSHGIQEIAVRGGGIPGFYSRLVSRYNYCKRTGLWANTYSMSTPQEYFAEGTQSFFNVNSYSPRPNGVQGPISTRAKLRNYDRILFGMIKEVFPCQNLIHDRCKGGVPPAFKMNCDRTGKPKPTKKPDATKKVKKEKTQNPDATPPEPTSPTAYTCTNKNKLCNAWKGYCKPGNTYTKYMMDNCRTTCSCCYNASKDCEAWKKQGLCRRGQNYYGYMNRYCKKSCRVCQRIAKS